MSEQPPGARSPASPSPRWTSLPSVGGALLVVCALALSAGLFHPALLVAACLVWLAVLPGCHRLGAREVVVVALLVRAVFLASDFHSNDLHRYLWEGRVQLAGESPFATPPDAPERAPLRDDGWSLVEFRDLPTVYPPLAQALFAAAAAGGLDELGFRNLMLAIDGLVVMLLVAWLASTGRPVGRAVLYAWSPVAVASSAAGHVDAWMLIFLVAMAWNVERGRWRWAAAALAASILAKTVAVLLLPWMALRQPRAVLVVTLPLIVLGTLPYLRDGNLLGSLVQFGTTFGFNAGPFLALEAIAPRLAPWLAASMLLFVVTGVAVAQPRIASAAAVSFAGLLLLSPTVHYWYLSWFLVMLPVVGPGAISWPLVGWAASMSLAAPAYVALATGGDRPGLVVLTVVQYAVPLGWAAWLVWTRRPRREPLPDRAAGPGRAIDRADASGAATASGAVDASGAATASGAVGGPDGTNGVDRVRRVGVVVPACREAENLARLLPAWRRTRVDRIVVADTPSGDATPAICAAIPGVEYRAVPERGYGAAVQIGLEAVQDCDVAVVCDADHLAGPEQIERLLAPFGDARVGLVTGARTNDDSLTGVQRAGNALVGLLIAFGWGRWFHDLGPYRALRISMWPPHLLVDRGFGWNVEMNVRALTSGITVVEVPHTWSHREHGTSRISGSLRGALGAGAGMLVRLFRLREEPCPRPSSS